MATKEHPLAALEPEEHRLAEAPGKKERALFAALEGLGSVVVAYSGGADSAYLAWAARQALGDRALAITADSASLPESHKRDAEQFARSWDIRHEYIATREFDNPDYVKN